MINLISLYKQLKLPTKESREAKFSASPIPGFPKHRLAKDIRGLPCLLIATDESTSSNRPASIKLEHLEVIYDVDCRISHDGKLEESRFTVISCTEEDTLMQEYFLRIGGAVVTAIGDSPTHKQISKAVDNLVELFRVMSEAPKKSVQGLWAELLVISTAADPTLMIRAWHRSPDDKYDFSAENQRIETKSATSKSRIHHFSLEQLNPPKGVDVLVASVFVERIGAGLSLLDLAEMVRTKINDEPDLLLYLDQMIGMTLGNNWRSAAKDKFDYTLAKKSLALFSSEVIPCIDSNLPKGISNVHFKVDLSNTPIIDKKLLNSNSGIFKAVLSK